MTEGLFAPDLFSASVPQFSAVSPALAERIRGVSALFSVEREIDSIEKSGGNELNSSNFRLHGAGRVWLLKRLPAALAPAANKGLAIAQWLHEQIRTG